MADPMSDERLAEIRERAGLAVEQLTGDGSSTEFCVQAMPYLLAEVERLRAELKEIRQHDETSGGVLYDVIRRTLAGALDEHEAVKAIERRLIQPLTAQRQEARAKAARGRRPNAAVSHAVAQRDAVALAAEADWERHGEEIAAYERTVAELIAERDEARAEVKRLRAALGIEVRRNSGRTVPSGAPDSVVRSWAREHNIPTNPKGRVAPDVRAAYEAAWRAEQDGDQADG